MTIADQPRSAIGPGADAAAPALLDVADGVGRVMGDRALYARMLGRFRKDYRAGAAPLRAAIAGGDIRLAHRMAHTLKGAAGMISAHALHRQASMLELALRNAAHGHADMLGTLDSALAAVLEVIDGMLAAEPARPRPAPASTFGVQSGPALVAQLAGLLASGDGAAVDLLEQSGASLKAALGEPGFSAVALAANEFDFEGALAALGRFSEAGRGTAGS